MAWSLLKVSGDPPKARGGHTMTLVERNIIVCGGQQHTAGTKFEYFGLEPYVLNTETLVWERPRVALGKGPAPRAWHTATPIDECLVFFGGRGEKKGTAKHIFNDLQCFDLTEVRIQIRQPARLAQPTPCAPTCEPGRRVHGWRSRLRKSVPWCSRRAQMRACLLLLLQAARVVCGRREIG